MKALCEPIARIANFQDKVTSHFWNRRYKAVRILDEESLLACAAYIDLKQIRAGMAETLEQGDYASVQRRVQAIKATALDADSIGYFSPSFEIAALDSASVPRSDAFLAPVSIDERKDPRRFAVLKRIASFTERESEQRSQGRILLLVTSCKFR